MTQKVRGYIWMFIALVGGYIIITLWQERSSVLWLSLVTWIVLGFLYVTDKNAT